MLFKKKIQIDFEDRRSGGTPNYETETDIDQHLDLREVVQKIYRLQEQSAINEKIREAQGKIW